VRWWNQPLPWVIVSAAVVAAGVVAAIAYANSGPPHPITAATPGTVGESLQVQAGIHIQPPEKGTYHTDPPSSGPHYSIPGQAPAPWGFSAQTRAPEYWVHNLEHGGVVVLYSCSQDCAADQATVQAFVSRAPRESRFKEVKLLAVKYPVSGHRFALVAWGWRLFMDTWDPNQALAWQPALQRVGRRPVHPCRLRHPAPQLRVRVLRTRDPAPALRAQHHLAHHPAPKGRQPAARDGSFCGMGATSAG